MHSAANSNSWQAALREPCKILESKLTEAVKLEKDLAPWSKQEMLEQVNWPVSELKAVHEAIEDKELEESNVVVPPEIGACQTAITKALNLLGVSLC